MRGGTSWSFVVNTTLTGTSNDDANGRASNFEIARPACAMCHGSLRRHSDINQPRCGRSG
ncbi:MAG: hypothetical protein EBR06_05150 [Acidimicrobiia bacterium]|nr:hypothetical protein [Acidimicrobiia bacterium]